MSQGYCRFDGCSNPAPWEAFDVPGLCPMHDGSGRMQRTGFESWDELLGFIATGQPLWYHAPLDVHPTWIEARPFKNRKIRVRPNGHSDGSFTAEECAEHLRRFVRC